MSDLIRRPDDAPAPVAISQTELKPVKAADDPSLWRKFVNSVRQTIGLKPLELAVRIAEAEVASREIENQVKLLKAKQEYERVQAEIQKTKAEAAEIRTKTRSKKARARIQEVAAREIERRGQTLEEAMQRFKQLVDKIQSLGGDVEIEPLDGEFDEGEDD